MARRQCARLLALLVQLVTIIFEVDGAVAVRRALKLGLETRGLPADLGKKAGGLLLPGNATIIRHNIVDSFSCESRIYGYYADTENDCQVFHVCLPRANSTARWSFICPSETRFNQATFVCTQTEDSIPCGESDKFYKLNEAIGKGVEEEEESDLEGVSLQH